MKLRKDYVCDNRIPSDAEIEEGIKIANEEHCIVNLNWHFPYSGWYSIAITKDMTFDECKDSLPKCYGV